MSKYHLSAFVLLLVLGGCATPPGSSPRHTAAPPDMPAMTTSAATTAKPATPALQATSKSMPAAAASTPPASLAAPALSPAANSASAAPITTSTKQTTLAAAKTDTKLQTSSETKPVAHVKHNTPARRYPAPPPPHKSHAASRVTLHGRVTLTAAAGQTVTTTDMTNTLVYFVPRAMKARPHPGHYTVYTNHHQFSTDAMAVPAGSTVSFVNLDSVDHNVFSVTPGNSFNQGYQSYGETTSHTFDHAGLVLISCNVHPAMELDLLVVPSPYAARVDTDGRFTLQHLPRGAGTLYVWNPRSRTAAQALSLPPSEPVQLHLLLRGPQVKTVLHVRDQP